MAKRGNLEGTYRERPDGRWEGKIMVGYSNDKPVLKSCYGATQKEAREKINKLIKEMENGTDLTKSDVSLQEWFEKWLSLTRLSRKETTMNCYHYTSKKYIYPFIGKQLLSPTFDLTQLKPNNHGIR